MNNVIDFINTNRDRYLDELKEYLAIPSISALPEHAADVRRCAEWTAAHMTRIGLQNVRDRLAARFGSEASVVSGSTGNGYATIIRIPLIRPNFP